MRRTLLTHARKNETRNLLIDFSGVTALDTSGVAMVVEIWRSLAKKGGKLRLSGLSENAKRLMHMARLDELIELAEDPEKGG